MFESAPHNPKKYLPSTEQELELYQFPKPRKKSDVVRAEIINFFEEAQRNLVNEKMFGLFVRAIREKMITGSNDTLAFLQNRIIQECINLSETETNLILGQFNREVRRWFIKNQSSSNIESKVYEAINSGKFTVGDNNIDTRGIWNVISFLRNRSFLLDSNPVVQYTHYFSDRLDARYSIDVIEEIGDPPVISLIQLKSSVPSEEEVRRINKDHQHWVQKGWMSLESYENNYIEEGTEEEIRSFLENKEEIRLALLDFFTDPEGQDIYKLISSLHLGSLDNRQKAWILWKYINLLEDPMKEAKEKDPENAQNIDSIWRQLNELRNKLIQKTKLPKSQNFVGDVYSVIVVGGKEVFKKKIEFGEVKVINMR